MSTVGTSRRTDGGTGVPDRGARESTPVLVAGAGPTGLATALVLARAGVPVLVVDPKQGPVRETRASVVHARTLELLDLVGLADEVVRDGSRVEGYDLHVDGRRVGTLPFRDDSRPPWTRFPFDVGFGQDRMERLLLEALQRSGVQVSWGWRLDDVEPGVDGVVAVLTRPAADGSGAADRRVVSAQWVVGADGAGSRARRLVGVGFPGRTDPQTYLVADVVLDRPLPPGRGRFEFSAAGDLSFFPMSGDRTYRLTAVLDAQRHPRGGVGAETVREVVDVATRGTVGVVDVLWHSTSAVQYRVADRFVTGRVVLVGDAARLHSPLGGQGMNNGIQDAFNLGWKLALVTSGTAGPELIASFDAERRRIALLTVRTIDRAGGSGTSGGGRAEDLVRGAVPRVISAVMRLPVVRRAYFRVVSQLWVAYRESPVVGSGGPRLGGARPGDRLPFVELADGRTTHDLVRPDRHVLVLVPGSGQRAVARPVRDAALLLRDRSPVPLAVEVLEPDDLPTARRLRSTTPTALLVRPDGHLAWRGPTSAWSALEAHLAHGLTETPRGAATTRPAPVP